jgi:hypothetical protein
MELVQRSVQLFLLITQKCWGLTPVILATQDAQVRKIVVQSPSQKRAGEWLKV